MSANLTVYNYRLYCNTESTWKYDYWGTVPPTKCTNDSSHNINSNSVNVIGQISQNKVSINEEQPPINQPATGGHFRRITKAFDIAPQTTQSLIFSFPYPVSILGGYMNTQNSQQGDITSIHIAPDTVIGVITSNVAINDTIINVSPTVITNIFVGAFVNLTNGTNVSNLIEVISIDKINNTITLYSGSNLAFTASAPTYVRVTYVYNHMTEIGVAGPLSIGTLTTNASYIPSNTNIKIIYQNNSSVTQRPVYQTEYLY